MSRKVLIIASEDWYFCMHLLPIARAALHAGFTVGLAAQISDKKELLEQEGIEIFPITIRRGSINPLHDVKTLWQLIKIYRTYRPDIIQPVAMKPVLYGTIAAWLCRMPYIVNTLVGTGLLFSSNQLYMRLIRSLVIRTLRTLINRVPGCIVVQNADNRELFTHLGIMQNKVIKQCCVGVNLKSFSPCDEPKGSPVFTLAARLLESKGVREFVEASRILKARQIAVRMVLVGEPDLANPTSISSEELKAWQDEGIIEWWGKRTDMAAVWQASDVCVLPSYSEGLSRSQLEAAACRRALITTDAPGCRELVTNNQNGLVVPVRDAPALANAIALLAQDVKLRQKLATAAYNDVRANYEEDAIAKKVVELYLTQKHNIPK